MRRQLASTRVPSLRLQLPEDSRNELRYCRVNMHGAQKSRIGRPCRHSVENSVNCFIAADAQDGGAENCLGLGVDDDLHKTVSFTFLDCPSDSRHRALAD